MKNWVVVWILLSGVFGSFAENIAQTEMLDQAQSWMIDHPVMGELADKTPDVFRFPEDSSYQVYVLTYAGGGFAILNSDDRLPFVVAFSSCSPVDLSDDPNNVFRTMLEGHAENMIALLADPQYSKPVAAIAPSELYGPFLETSWNQSDPYNLYCPVGGSLYGYDGRVPSGCVPVAFAQLLAFHRWPLYGEGSHSYTDSSGSITGSHSVSFADSYDWSNMPAAVSSSSPSAEQNAVAELMYELGVAAEADYEVDGTAASSWSLAITLSDYFNFESSPQYHSSRAALIAPMESELRAGFPCVVGIPSHAIMADGLMIDGGVTTYHINYGWGGTNNGWWTAAAVPEASSGAGGGLSNGITGLRPNLMAYPESTSLTADVGDDVTLAWIFPKRREADISALNLYKEDGASWIPVVSDATLTSERFSSVSTLIDDCDDFTSFELTTSSSVYSADWVVTNVSEVGNCFFKDIPEYGGYLYHLTSLSTIIPTASSRLVVRAKYNLNTDVFRILVSTDRSNFTEIWSDSAQVDWSDLSVDLSSYAGQSIYIRLEYEGGSSWQGGGIWIDSVSMESVTNPEFEGQPIHYCTFSNVTAGVHTLAAVLENGSGTEQGRGPTFTLTVDDNDGIPLAWEQQYGLDITTDDSTLDPDSDGLNNLEEYICGTIPTNAASSWALQESSGAYPEFQGYTGRFYTIWGATSLVVDCWTVLASDVPGSNAVIEVQNYDASAHHEMFYKIEVKTP